MVKLKAEFEGIVFTRKTDRTYTHVIIVKDKDQPWKAESWAGSYDLAVKRLSSFSIPDRIIRIIPVTPMASK